MLSTMGPFPLTIGSILEYGIKVSTLTARCKRGPAKGREPQAFARWASARKSWRGRWTSGPRLHLAASVNLDAVLEDRANG